MTLSITSSRYVTYRMFGFYELFGFCEKITLLFPKMSFRILYYFPKFRLFQTLFSQITGIMVLICFRLTFLVVATMVWFRTTN